MVTEPPTHTCTASCRLRACSPRRGEAFATDILTTGSQRHHQARTAGTRPERGGVATRGLGEGRTRADQRLRRVPYSLPARLTLRHSGFGVCRSCCRPPKGSRQQWVLNLKARTRYGAKHVVAIPRASILRGHETPASRPLRRDPHVCGRRVRHPGGG